MFKKRGRRDARRRPVRAAMTVSALARETWRDMMTGTAWTGIWVIVTVLLIGGSVCLDLAVISRALDSASAYQESASNIRVIQTNRAIDGASCHALSRLPGVRGAAAVRSTTSRVRVNVLPSTSLDVYETTPGIRDVIPGRAGDSASGIVVSQGLAESVGAADAAEVLIDDDEVPFAHVYSWDENDGRRSGFAYTILAPVPPSGVFDECWVRMWPMNADIDAYMRLAVIPDGNGQQRVDMSSLNSTLGTTFSGAALYRDRLTAPIVWILAALGALIGIGAVWRRRLEIASDLHAGVWRVDLAAKVAIQAASVAGIALVLSAPVVAAIIVRAPGPDHVSLWRLAAIELGVGLGCLITASLATALIVREEKLFDYFKSR
ncbi:hypothetical protein [Actinomyces mediterranea]|uniref:hypothetical protein n=1 Tax=Actinomyces mediterranea TaxID=1871028 RepID=UPI00101AD263|nr:hypothetical protein [Actinomyces mediterranea]